MSAESRFNFWLKEYQSPDVPKDELEIAHIESLFRGGDDDSTNKIALTKIEHAFQHFQDAKYDIDWKNSQKDYGAVRLIYSRMSPSEKKVFNYMITHEKG